MFEKFKLLVQIIPSILDLIKSVEAALPEEGKGKAKLEFVRETIIMMIPQVADMWTQVRFIIERAVILYNVTGVFRKKQSPSN